MTEKQVCIVVEDDIGSAQTNIKTELSAPQVLDKILMLASENEELRIRNELLSDENEQYKALVQNKWGEYVRNKEKECE